MKAVSGIVVVWLIFVLFLTGCTQEEPKIAVVDIGRVIGESQEGKRANAELEALVKEKRSGIAGKSEELDKLKKNLDKEPPATRKNKEDELVKMNGDYQKMVAAYEAEIQRKAADLKTNLVKEIRKVVDSVGTEGKYLVILSTENAPYFQKTIDVSDKVIMKYNELQGNK